MNLTRSLLQRKILVSMLFTGLVLLGVVSYQQLPVELFPNAELPFLIVQVSGLRDLDPDYLERQAIIPLEGAVSTLEGIDKIESFADRRQGLIFVYFNQNINLKFAFLRMEEKVELVRGQLPQDVFVNVIKIDTEQLANVFMSLQVRGSGGPDRVREIIDQRVTSDLENIDGIASVDVSGGREKSIEIILDPQACEAYGVTPGEIRNFLSQNNHSKTFVGKAYNQKSYYFVNTVADYADVRQIENIIVNPTGPVHLGDVADVYFGVKEQTTISRVNGKDAVTVQLVRDSQVNLVALSHATRGVIDRLNKKLASLDVEIVIQSDSAEQIEKNINMIKKLALVGGLLAVFVLWIFLRNLRWVLLITLAIPISIFTAFNFFYAAGITINSLTLVGMALAIGMLLDNSVVVMENIYRLLSTKQDIDTSVVQGAQEVWRSIIAATLTTITVFLPFVFASNFIIKLFGRHIGVSIISTLLVSLVVALLLIPMATHALLSRHRRQQHVISFQKVSLKNRLVQIYNVILKSCMRFPARTIIGAVFFFFTSLILSLAVSINVPQEVDSRSFNLYITMPSGATLDQTDAIVADAEERLKDLAEREDVISRIYEDEAVVTIKLLKDFQDIDNRSLSDIKESVENRVEDIGQAEISFEQPQSSQRFRGGGGQNPGADFERLLGIGTASERVVIKGKDFVQMRNLGEDIADYLDELTTVSRTSINVAEDRPEIHLLFDDMLLNQYGINLASIGNELSSFSSEVNSQLTFKQGTDEYDIVIRTEELEDKTIDDLRELPVTAQTGDRHELQDISQIVYSSGMSSIHRVNQEKQVEVTYQFAGEVTDSKDFLTSARQEVDAIIAKLNIPSGIAVEVIHEEKDLQEFYFLIGAAFLLIYMILASVFESLSTPVVMMFTIPLAAIGSLWGLILTGNSLLTANTLTGFLILLGVVVNNGIIYVDYTRLLRRRGYSRSRALMTAGHARVRPILITAITTIIAMIPLAMGKADYVEKIGAPFAITVIGGLTLSTVFTIVFIPTLYSGLENSLAWIRSLNWKIKIIQLVAFLAGCYLIYENVNSLIWRSVNLFVLVLLVPGATYFVLTSLRRAQSEFISADEPLTIRIQHLVKIYDEQSRFLREWKKGKSIREKVGLEKDYKSLKDFDDWIWKLPFLSFLVYFVYFYLNSYFWCFVLTHIVYVYLFYLWSPLQQYLQYHPGTFANWFERRGRTLILWGFPVFNLFVYVVKWQAFASIIFIGVLWGFLLIVYTSSNKLHRENVNIARIKGKLSGLRRAFYSFVRIIPVVGKKKRPFRALDGVSMEIKNGMFGLLGPNGAGKTTLMRIICGILDQSRGKIRINDLDLSEYREEFQGLIGYLPQEFGMYENMTAHEFLQYQAMLKGITDATERDQRINVVLGAVHMDAHRDEKIGSFSGGMKQRIGIAQTLLHLPRILVVDEPTAGLDPRERIRFRNLLVELSRERIVIFSTHIIEDISSSCRRVAVLDRGQLQYLGEPMQMTTLADGKVWQLLVDASAFAAYNERLQIVHHIRVGDHIRLRCISEEKPEPDATLVKPTLEDAYLWLLKRKVTDS